jgi:hypothetical protein
MKSPGASVSDTIAVPQLVQACGVLWLVLMELIPAPDPPQAVNADTPINTSIRRIRNTALFMALYMDASRCARTSRCDGRQIRLQVYIRPVLQTVACGP